jgi:hypothetical protein
MYKYTVGITCDITVTSHIMKAQKLYTVSTIVNITFSNTVDSSMNLSFLQMYKYTVDITYDIIGTSQILRHREWLGNIK